MNVGKSQAARVSHRRAPRWRTIPASGHPIMLVQASTNAMPTDFSAVVADVYLHSAQGDTKLRPVAGDECRSSCDGGAPQALILIDWISATRCYGENCAPFLQSPSLTNREPKTVPDFIGYLSNFLGQGEEMTENSSGAVTRNKIRLKLGQFDAELIQSDDAILKMPVKFRGTNSITTTVTIRSLAPEDFETAKRSMVSLALLLGFASYSDVAFCGYEFAVGDKLASRWQPIGVADYFRPAIDIRDGAAVRSFVESSWSGFESQRTARRLSTVIYCAVAPETFRLPLEMKLTTIFVLLENLKSTYAATAGYVFNKRFWASTLNPRVQIPLKILLTEMLSRVGMSICVDKIAELRNNIVHEGISSMDYNDQFSIYDECQDIVREYILRLIGYKGEFNLYSDCRSQKTI